MGGRGSNSSLGKTYQGAPKAIKNQIDRIVDVMLWPDENEQDYFEQTGHFDAYVTIPGLNGKNLRITSEIDARKEGEAFDSKNLRYNIKQGNKFIVKNGTKNNIKNYIAVEMKKVGDNAKYWNRG